MPFALDGDVRLGPERLHHVDLLFRAAAAIVEILVEPDKLDVVPADPDAEPKPAAAQHVEAGGLLGDQHGLTLRQDQHLGRKIRDPRAPGEKAEQDERVVVEVGRAAAALRPFRPARDIDPEHMVRGGDPLIADRLRRLDEIADRVRLSADVDNRQRHAELHLPPPFGCRGHYALIAVANHRGEGKFFARLW